MAANQDLESLELEACYLLTDASLSALAAHAPSIANLNLRLCNALSMRGILEFARNAQRLASLQLSGVLASDRDVRLLVGQVRQLRPNVRLVW